MWPNNLFLKIMTLVVTTVIIPFSILSTLECVGFVGGRHNPFYDLFCNGLVYFLLFLNFIGIVLVLTIILNFVIYLLLKFSGKEVPNESKYLRISIIVYLILASISLAYIFSYVGFFRMLVSFK